MFASRKKVTDVTKPVVPIQMQQQPQSIQSNVTNQQKLELAKRVAARINIAKKLGPESQDIIIQQTASAILKGGGMSAPQVAVSKFYFIIDSKVEKLIMNHIVGCTQSYQSC